MSEQERRHWLILAIASGIFAVDQTTKWYWVGVTNGDFATGAWGSGRWQSVIVSLLALAAITVLMVRVRAPWWSLVLVIGGAMSNIWDRVAYGAVRDFIPTGHWRWNIADAAIYLGLATWALSLLLKLRKGGTYEEPDHARDRRRHRGFGHRRVRAAVPAGAQVPAVNRSSGRGFHPLDVGDPSSPRPVDEYEEDETEEN